jgi:hypothetical protein
MSSRAGDLACGPPPEDIAANPLLRLALSVEDTARRIVEQLDNSDNMRPLERASAYITRTIEELVTVREAITENLKDQ